MVPCVTARVYHMLTRCPESLEWTHIDVSPQQNRLSHTTSLVGNFLYIIGGHNGHAYAQDVLVLDLCKWSDGV